MRISLLLASLILAGSSLTACEHVMTYDEATGKQELNEDMGDRWQYRDTPPWERNNHSN